MQRKNFKLENTSYLSLFLAQTLVGISIVGSKAMLAYFSPLFILSIRFIIATSLLLIIHVIITKFNASKNKPKLSDLTKKDWVFISAQAICAGTFFNILLLIGLHYTDASVAGIITSALPAIVAIFSIIFLRERLTIFTLLCIAFAIIGLLVINAHNFRLADSKHLLGDFIILMALLPEAAYYVLAKAHQPKLPIFLFSALLNGLNIPFLLIAGLITPHFLPAAYPINGLLILGVVSLASALFYIFWVFGAKFVEGSTAGLFTAVMPIATLVIAWLFLQESVSMLQLLGMFLVIISIVFNAMRQYKRNP